DGDLGAPVDGAVGVVAVVVEGVDDAVLLAGQFVAAVAVEGSEEGRVGGEGAPAGAEGDLGVPVDGAGGVVAVVVEGVDDAVLLADEFGAAGAVEVGEVDGGVGHGAPAGADGDLAAPVDGAVGVVAVVVEGVDDAVLLADQLVAAVAVE